jgi:hypothetical protein
MIGRIIGGALIAIVSYFLVKKLRGMSDDSTGRVQRNAEQARVTSKDLVTCSRCGVNIPMSEAKQIEDGYACSEGEQCANRTH